MEHRAHPAKAKLALQRISARAAAAALDPPCTPHYLGRVLNGHIVPSERITRQICELLEGSVDELFDPEILGFPPADLLSTRKRPMLYPGDAALRSAGGAA